MNKYEFTGETMDHYGVPLHRIRAVEDNETHCVERGDLGGWIELESNLSQEGGAWVGGEAKVYGEAKVMDNAHVTGEAEVCGESVIAEYARVSGRVEICDSQVHGYASIEGDARLSGNVEVKDNVLIRDYAIIYKRSVVKDNAIVSDNARIFKSTVCGRANIGGDAYIKDDSIISGGEIREPIAIGDLNNPVHIRNYKDIYIFKNNWSSGRYFYYLPKTKTWHVGCFKGTGNELIKKAYKDSKLSGKMYAHYVKLVKDMEGEPSMDKYKITIETKKVKDRTVFRIQALTDIEAHGVKKGDLGGWVDTPYNLSQQGDAWIGGNAVVMDYANVSGSALVTDNAIVMDKAIVSERAKVSGMANVEGNVSGQAIVNSHSYVFRDATINGLAYISGMCVIWSDSLITDKARVDGYADISGATIKGCSVVGGRMFVKGDVTLENVTLEASITISGYRKPITLNSNKDILIFMDNWSLDKPFYYLTQAKEWHTWWFTGTSDELLDWAEKDTEYNRNMYAHYVKLVEDLEENYKNDKRSA